MGLKFEQQKITKRLVFAHIKYSFFHSQCKVTFTGPESARPALAAADMKISQLQAVSFFLLSGVKVSTKYIRPPGPWPTWTFCLNRNEYWLVFYAEKQWGVQGLLFSIQSPLSLAEDHASRGCCKACWGWKMGHSGASCGFPSHGLAGTLTGIIVHFRWRENRKLIK